MARNLVNKVTTPEIIDLINAASDGAGITVEIKDGTETIKFVVDDETNITG